MISIDYSNGKDFDKRKLYIEFSFFNYLYSPNLMMFFDSNDSGDQFSIRNTFDHSLVVNIPSGILSSKINKPKHIVKHLLWLSNT